jgi:putative FmdB family regulatory protein
MPRYEFRCRSCGDTFEVDRPMRAAGEPADCPRGHGDTVKLLSTVSLAGRSGSGPAPAPVAGRSAAAGGCCGGACCS